MDQPKRYEQMSRAAVARMRDHCSEQIVRERLERILLLTLAQARAGTHGGAMLKHPHAAFGDLVLEELMQQSQRA
jgi:hypothetical protein